MKLSSWCFIATIFYLVFLSYVNSLENEFVWDDHTIIERNENIKDIANIKAILLSEDTTEDMPHTGFYRPVVALSYAIDYHFWGLAPSGFRLINIFFHFLTALLVYFLGVELFGNRRAGLFAAALFALHPVNVESVSFISARGSQMCGFYYLLSLFCFIQYRKGSRRALNLTVSALAFFIAFLAKEFAITLFVLMIGYDIVYRDRRAGPKSVALAYIPYFALCGLFFWLRNIATAGNSLALNIFTPDIFVRIIDALRIIARYVLTLILPVDLSVEYNFAHAKSLLSYETLVAVAILFLLIFHIYRFKKTENALFIPLLIFIAPLLLVAGIIPIQGESALADRWLYIPSAGFMLIAGYYIDAGLGALSNIKAKRVALSFAILIIVFLCVKTIERNQAFSNELSLWSDTVKKSPESFKAHLNYGFALYQAGSREDAFEEFSRALEVKPDSVQARYNIAVFYQNGSKYKKAIDEYEHIIAGGAIFADIAMNLGECYRKLGDSIEALIYYKRALKINPVSPDALYNIATLYRDLHNEKMATEYMRMYKGSVAK